MRLWKLLSASAVILLFYALPVLSQQEEPIDFAKRESQLAGTATDTQPVSSIEIITISDDGEETVEEDDVIEEVTIEATAEVTVDDAAEPEQPVETPAPAETAEPAPPVDITIEATAELTVEEKEVQEVTIEAAAELTVEEQAPEPEQPVIDETADSVPAEPGDVESMEPAQPEPAPAAEAETPEQPEAAPANPAEASQPEDAQAEPEKSEINIVVDEEVELRFDEPAEQEETDETAAPEPAAAEEPAAEPKAEPTPLPRQPVPAPATETKPSDMFKAATDDISFPMVGTGVIFATGSSDLFGDFSADTYTGPREISIENDFIKIVVNTMDVDTGRFLVRTVKGDPFRATDDNKILIYGGAVPWTSFTTLRINGENYVFGGPTNRRAGRDALYGTCEKPTTVGEDTIITRCNIAGLEVTQSFSIVGGPVSRLYDTVRINTVIRNPSMDPIRVGVRTVIDTLLGSNDGSPFKVGEDSITSERELRGLGIQDYWIAYDSLEDPGVVARGTLRGPGLTTPDRVVFANWGKLADNIWNIPYRPGQTFQRAGETGMDSAIALYWDETTLMPDGETRYSTLYGIEYLNVAGDILSIGAYRNLGEWPTARNRIKPYTVYAYAGNSSDIVLNNVLISLELPEEIDFAGDDTGYRRLGTLEPGQEKTIGWTLVPRIGTGGDKVIRVIGAASEVERVELETNVSLLPPPEIIPTIEAPKEIKRSESRKYGPYGPPFPIKVKCYNDGKYHVDNMRVKLMLPEGLTFPRVETAVQDYKRLNGQQSEDFVWNIVATGDKSGPLVYKIIIESESTEPKTVTGVVNVEPLEMTANWIGVPDTAYKGNFVSAELYVTDIPELGFAEFTINYDPEVLDVIRFTQGTLFVDGNRSLPWKDPVVDRKAGTIVISASRETPLDKNEGSLVRVHFLARRQGEATISVTDGAFKDLSGNALDIVTVPRSLKVTE